MFERRWHALFAGAALLVVASVLTIAVGVDPTEPVVQPADDLWMEWMLEVRDLLGGATGDCRELARRAMGDGAGAAARRARPGPAATVDPGWAPSSAP